MNTIYLKIEDDETVMIDGDMKIIRFDFKVSPWEVADAILAYFHYMGIIEYIGDEKEKEKIQ